MAPTINRTYFDEKHGNFAIILLGFFIANTLMVDGLSSVIKGLGLMKQLAISAALSTFVGLIVGLPVIYLLEVDGLVIRLIIFSFVGTILMWRVLKKHTIFEFELNLKKIFVTCNPIIILGIFLCLVSLINQFSKLLIKDIVSGEDNNIELIGLYNVGVALSFSYFAIIITALNTDFYTKIYSNVDDHIYIKERIKNYIRISLSILIPMIITLMIFGNELISLLYTKEFVQIMPYINIAIVALVINLYADALGVFLIAKGEKAIYLTICIVNNFVLLLFSITLYREFGFVGLGIGLLISSLIHLFLTNIIVQLKYNIGIGLIEFSIGFATIIIALLGMAISLIGGILIKIGILTLISAIHFFIIYKYSKHFFGFEINEIVIRKTVK